MNRLPTDGSLQEEAAVLKRAVRRGAAAAVLVQISSQVISLLGVAILMRLLMPVDYGLVGMVVPVIMLLRIFTTLGLNVATIQRRELESAEVSSVFWMNVLFGLVTTAATVAVAPALGWIYGDPELAVPLRDLAWGLAATAIVAALGAQHQALMERPDGAYRRFVELQSAAAA